MAKTKKTKMRDLPPDHDFTFQEQLNSILRFNDKTVLMIEFNASTNEIYVRREDDKTGAILSGRMTLEQEE